jgi:putative membrane protein
MLPDLALLVPVAGAGALYLRGWRRRAAAGAGVTSGGEPWRFVAGLGVVLVALAPVVDDLAHRSFAGHMLQHLLLTIVAAPLIGTARPLATLAHAVGSTRALPDRWSRGPAVAWAALTAGGLHLATMLVWHLPPLYDAALASPTLHQLEHLTLLGTAVAAWTAVVAAARAGGTRTLAAVVALAANALAGAGLGVVLLSAPIPLYDGYAALGAVALDEQRLGGAMMKVGSVLVHAGAAVWITAAWLHRLQRDTDGGEVASPTPAPTRR